MSKIGHRVVSSNIMPKKFGIAPKDPTMEKLTYQQIRQYAKENDDYARKVDIPCQSNRGRSEVITYIMLGNACICQVRFKNASTRMSRWFDNTLGDKGLGLLNEHQYCIDTRDKVNISM